MLRLPRFDIAEPRTVREAVQLLVDHAPDVTLIAGGTDLLPNMKHRLLEPKLVVALGGIDELGALRVESDGALVIGAMNSLDAVAASDDVKRRAPALAEATAQISSPQLRRSGTLGGNVMLDTRCRWYNQSRFWRKSLGYCLKKDGTVCHVVPGGRKCVAAASNDSVPALTTLGARLVFEGQAGRREIPIEELWKSDGVFNKHVAPNEILVEVRVPPQHHGHRGAYRKLRDRAAIDFPQLGVAVRLDLAASGEVEDADVVLVALQARPIRVKGVADVLSGKKAGTSAFDGGVASVADHAFRQCHPMANIPGDPDYRRDMVPVLVRQALSAAARPDAPAIGVRARA